MNKEIELTKNFRIVMDENQYRVQRLHKVDPTKAPRYNPEKHGTEIKMKWKDDGYYSLTDNGLRAAIKSVIIGESGVSGKERLSLKEYLQELKEISKVVFENVDIEKNKNK